MPTTTPFERQDGTIDITSIDTNNPTRDHDLRSKSFFDVV